MAHNPLRRNQVDTHITTPAVPGIHSDLHMFDAGKVGVLELFLGDFDLALQSFPPLRNGMIDKNNRRLVPALGLDRFEILGRLHDCIGIDFSVTITMAEHLARGSLVPHSVVLVYDHCRLLGKVLKISPREIRPNGKYEGKDTGRKRGCSGCATMARIAAIGTDVGCVLLSVRKPAPPLSQRSKTYNCIAASTAIRDNHLGGTMLRIIGMLSFPVYCADCDAIYAVGIAIKVAVVAAGRPVAGCEYEYGAFALATVIDSLEDCLLDQDPRSLHCSSVIGGAPATRINLIFLVGIVESNCFIGIGYLSGKDPDSGNLAIVCHTDTADVIPHSSDLSGASGSVPVIRQTGSGLRRVIVEIVRALCKLRKRESEFSC